jgi:hypothetical protein
MTFGSAHSALASHFTTNINAAKDFVRYSL